MTTFIYSFPLIILSLYFIPSTVSVSLNETDNYVRRISDSDLFYAAESRNYPETPDTLFVTMRGGGVKVFDISEPAELKGVAQWVTDKAVEGQDRVGDLLVVAELGRGPNGAFASSKGPALHLFHVSNSTISPATPNPDKTLSSMTPYYSVDLSEYIDAILHVKFVTSPPGRPSELWAVCSGGFATTVTGAVVLVNLTAVATPALAQTATATATATAALKLEVSVLATPVEQPEGVMVAPTDSSIVYIGGIDSHDLGIVDISLFSTPVLVETHQGVGMQLVGATRKDQPVWPSATSQTNTNTNTNKARSEVVYADADLVYMAGWGARGSLVVLNSSSAAHPSLQCRTPPSQDLQLAMANRVKLYQDWALVPLETRLGGFGVIDISGAVTNQEGHEEEGKEGMVSQVVSVHVPVKETTAAEGGGVVSAKAYCLAISKTRHVYLFIAETAAVYVYCLDDVLREAGVSGSDDGCSTY